MIEFIKTNIQDDGITFLSINRTPVNALSIQLIEELHETVNKLIDNDNIRCIIFHSGHKNFCAGADLK